jgi:hypothetical protein
LQPTFVTKGASTLLSIVLVRIMKGSHEIVTEAT